MSKIRSLLEALENDLGNPVVKPEPDTKKKKASSREGKEYTGAWLNADFGLSLRLVQIKRRRDDTGKKIYLDDLLAEALNDLFRKYDVPTAEHL